MTIQEKNRWKFIGVIILAVMALAIAYPKTFFFIPPLERKLETIKINLGLDLQGGIHLEYRADTSQVDSGKINDAMQAVQDVIERRVNAFGVAEPTIYTSRSGSERRLIVELAGVRDIEQAKSLIKETPFLEFKEEAPALSQDELDKENAAAKQKAEDLLKKALSGEDFATLAKENSEDPGSASQGGDLGFAKKGEFVSAFDNVIFNGGLKNGQIYPQVVESDYGWHIIKKIATQGEGDNLEVDSAHILIAKKTNTKSYVSTGLTGKNLKSASVSFKSQGGLSEPEVSLEFDDEGTKLFASLTRKNLQKTIAIYLDGKMLTNPTVQSEITSGEAVITGNYSIDEAKALAGRLNEGALPVPITLVSQQSVEATLGSISLQKSLKAGILGLALVVIFMIFYYRFLGILASLALFIYTAIMIAIFKLSGFTPWQITLTLPGIAGFILSIGMAVDANILIFERTKEEIKNGRHVYNAIEEGFKRAWTSIRDGNSSSIITSIILVFLGTGFVKGFAVTLIIGVLVSMFTAIFVTETLLRFFIGDWILKHAWLLGVRQKDLKPVDKK